MSYEVKPHHARVAHGSKPHQDHSSYASKPGKGGITSFNQSELGSSVTQSNSLRGLVDRGVGTQSRLKRAQIFGAWSSLDRNVASGFTNLSPQRPLSPPIGPTTLQASLAQGKLGTTQQLLGDHFDLVAKDEYAWLCELRHLSYSSEEIAELLLNETYDSPWIYIERKPGSKSPVALGFHQPNCVHQGYHRGQGAVPIEDSISVGYHRNKVIIHAQLNMILLLDTHTIRTGTQPLYIHIRVSLPHL